MGHAESFRPLVSRGLLPIQPLSSRELVLHGRALLTPLRP